jgi:hypothetical protein
MCASACFFVFVGGIHRKYDLEGLFGGPALGVHRPYLRETSLKALSSDQALAAANQNRTMVEAYLKEMGIPQKYADQMFLVSKDEVKWISEREFDADFEGFIPELKDWVDAKCDDRTEVEKKIWKQLEHTSSSQQTSSEKIMMGAIMEKMLKKYKCEVKERGALAFRAILGQLKQ